MKKSIYVAFLALLLVACISPVELDTQTINDQDRSQTTGKHIQLSHGKTYFEIAGPSDGQTVLLVHGILTPSHIWDPTFKALVDAGFRVIRYDLYGRGYSDRPDRVYDHGLYETQLMELLTALKVEQPVDVVAISMGAAIAASFVAKHPEKVRKLVFFAPHNEPAKAMPMNVPIIGEFIVRNYYLPTMIKKQAQAEEKSDLYKGWTAKLRKQLKYRGTAQSVLSSIQNVSTKDSVPYYHAIGSQGRPVLLFWGEEDDTLPFSQNKVVREALRSAEFVSLPNVGHLANVDGADTVNPRLIGFLSKF